jgi:hypothetical protein
MPATLNARRRAYDASDGKRGMRRSRRRGRRISPSLPYLLSAVLLPRQMPVTVLRGAAALA